VLKTFDAMLTDLSRTGLSGQEEYEDIALPRSGPPVYAEADITTTTPGDGYTEEPRRHWVHEQLTWSSESTNCQDKHAVDSHTLLLSETFSFKN